MHNGNVGDGITKIGVSNTVATGGTVIATHIHRVAHNRIIKAIANAMDSIGMMAVVIAIHLYPAKMLWINRHVNLRVVTGIMDIVTPTNHPFLLLPIRLIARIMAVIGMMLLVTMFHHPKHLRQWICRVLYPPFYPRLYHPMC